MHHPGNIDIEIADMKTLLASCLGKKKQAGEGRMETNKKA